jgi:penicillin-binding protein-related factor A (putative recombinase)
MRFNQKIKSHAQQGKAFETMVRASLKRLSDAGDIWFTRLWDFRSFIRLNPNFRVMRQPGDFIASCLGRFYVIECKSSQAGRFNLENFREHQEAAMKELHMKGGGYWLLILHRAEANADNTLYALDCVSWLKLKSHVKRSAYKTAAWVDVSTFCTMQLERKGGVWNLAPLFKEAT